MITVGQQIPELRVEALAEGEDRRLNLGDYRGRWLVLLFYPADFTFICPTELGETSAMYDQFVELDAEVLSVSTDTVFVHKAWRDSSPLLQGLRFPMVADPTGRLCREFGTYIEDEGISRRASAIVDPDGILRAMDMHDNSVGRNVREVLRKLRAAAYVRAHDGQVCPVGWEPGDETLTPGMDLVGKL